jgi:hypothetical protein
VTRRGRAIRIARLTAFMAVAHGSVPPSARADLTKAQCVDANVSAQDLRRDGRLGAARVELVKCAGRSCPALVRDDCTRRLDEVDKAEPTIAFEVKAAGADVFAVTIMVDGKPWTDTVEGKPIPVDPGKHVFTFSVAGHPSVTRTFVLTEGEKGRREQIVLESAPATSATSAPSSAPEGSAAPSVSGNQTSAPAGGIGAQKVLGLGAAGVGVVGLGLGAAFGLMSTSAWKSAQSTCGGNVNQCADVPGAEPHRHTALTDATISTVSFIAGGVLVAAGGLLFFTAGSPRETDAAATSLTVAPVVGSDQAGIAVKGAF